MGDPRPKLAVWKFSSCDGCQLSLLDCEDQLLALSARVEIANFLEASSTVQPGPYDLSLVEGSITTADDQARIQEVRRQSKLLVSIGACATAGGIQALRNFKDVRGFISAVYAHPEYIDTLERSTPIAEHVKVDHELRGCPISKAQLLELIGAVLQQRKPNLPLTSVCADCKRRGNLCLLVARGTPCLGPVTQSGCDALCPSYQRGCFGCFGPKESSNATSLARALIEEGRDPEEIDRLLHTFNAWADGFRAPSTPTPAPGGRR